MTEENKGCGPTVGLASDEAATVSPSVAGSSADQIIYIVHGSTGEYSDRSEWVVRAFRIEELARAFVETLSVERQKLGQRPADWRDCQAQEAAMRLFDPQFTEDYTGTTWWVAACPLDAAQ